MSKKSISSINEKPFSFRDAVNFLIKSWKIIALAGFIGIVAAIVYSHNRPIKYQSTALIKIGQIKLNANTNLVLTEDLNIVAKRASIMHQFDSDIIASCGNNEYEKNIIKVVVPKSLSIIKVSVVGEVEEEVIHCAKVVYDAIKKASDVDAQFFIEDAKLKKVRYEDRLKNLQAFKVNNDIANSVSLGIYLSTRDEIRFLRDEISRLNDIIYSAKTHETRLLRPITLSVIKFFHPVIIYLLGLFVGSFMGFILMIFRNYYLTYTRFSAE